MHVYADANNSCLPPAAIDDKDGQPLLSWRVALLPYLEEQALYDRFHLSEPWDSAHNIALLKEMPPVYRRPGRTASADDYATIYQVFIGPGTIFESQESRNLGVITSARGTSQTLLVVEAGEAVPWIKPADLLYGTDRPLPPLGGLFKNRGFRPFSSEPYTWMFQAAFADGHVDPLPQPHSEIEEARIRALIPYKEDKQTAR